jgi:DNA-binding GntR family transcriptional regulator
MTSRSKPETESGHRLLRDRAYEEVLALIQGGQLAPGGFLSERRLARRFGMSKTPVHSALERLDQEGFVALAPQQGAVIREMSTRETLDLLEFRTALEIHVVRSLAGRLTPVQDAQLAALLVAEAPAARAGDPAEISRLDAEFHIALCAFLGNREILRSMHRLRDKLHRLVLHVMAKAPRDRPMASHRQHAAIVEALRRGHRARAAECMNQHLEYAKKLMLSGS